MKYLKFLLIGLILGSSSVFAQTCLTVYQTEIYIEGAGPTLNSLARQLGVNLEQVVESKNRIDELETKMQLENKEKVPVKVLGKIEASRDIVIKYSKILKDSGFLLGPLHNAITGNVLGSSPLDTLLVSVQSDNAPDTAIKQGFVKKMMDQLNWIKSSSRWSELDYDKKIKWMPELYKYYPKLSTLPRDKLARAIDGLAEVAQTAEGLAVIEIMMSETLYPMLRAQSPSKDSRVREWTGKAALFTARYGPAAATLSTLGLMDAASMEMISSAIGSSMWPFGAALGALASNIYSFKKSKKNERAYKYISKSRNEPSTYSQYLGQKIIGSSKSAADKWTSRLRLRAAQKTAVKSLQPVDVPPIETKLEHVESKVQRLEDLAHNIQKDLEMDFSKNSVSIPLWGRGLSGTMDLILVKNLELVELQNKKIQEHAATYEIRSSAHGHREIKVLNKVKLAKLTEELAQMYATLIQFSGDLLSTGYAVDLYREKLQEEKQSKLSPQYHSFLESHLQGIQVNHNVLMGVSASVKNRMTGLFQALNIVSQIKLVNQIDLQESAK